MLEQIFFTLMSLLFFVLLTNSDQSGGLTALGRDLKKLSVENYVNKQKCLAFVRKWNKEYPINPIKFKSNKKYGIITITKHKNKITEYELDYFIYWDENYDYIFEEKGQGRFLYGVRKSKKDILNLKMNINKNS